MAKRAEGVNQSARRLRCRFWNYGRLSGFRRLPKYGLQGIFPRFCVWRGHPHLQDKARYNRGSTQDTHRSKLLADDKLFKAEYLGSGTFVISKPKRKKHKMRQTALKNPGRGSRK